MTGNCGACWHLWSKHGPGGCLALVYPAHSLNGEPCPCEHTGPEPASCGSPMAHPDGFDRHADGTPVDPDNRTSPCALPKGHYIQIEDSDHYDEHGCIAPVLVRQSTIREVELVGREWPDGVHTCAELQRAEPGRRPCTCGRCPRD